jgi:hypothetical protein
MYDVRGQGAVSSVPASSFLPVFGWCSNVFCSLLLSSSVGTRCIDRRPSTTTRTRNTHHSSSSHRTANTTLSTLILKRSYTNHGYSNYRKTHSKHFAANESLGTIDSLHFGSRAVAGYCGKQFRSTTQSRMPMVQ